MKRLFILLFILLPMMLSAQNITVKTHPNKSWLYGYWGVKKNGKEGFVIKPKFENAHPFAGDYAFVCQKGLWGIIGKDGKFVVEPKYDKASEPYNGVTIVSLGGKFGLVKDSKEVLPIEYEYIANFGNAYKLKSNGLFGLANANGKIVLETKYKDVLYLQNNTFAVYSNKLEFVNSEGKVVERPNNILLYTSKEGKTIDRSKRGYNYWQVNVVSNTYQNGQGIMVFDKPITSIGECAFYSCSGLTSITIPNSVTAIGDSAFFRCDGLTSITIPNSVAWIGEGAFADCSSLKEFNGKYASPDGRCLIVDGVLNSFTPGGLTKYAIPNSVTSIGNYAFAFCDGLTSITIPNSVTLIEDGAFAFCDGLTSITIPNSVTLIEEGAFAFCDGLTSITIPNGVTSIGEEAFCGCDRLTSITIPNSVTEIGSKAFYDCDGLTSVKVGNGVTLINDATFENCRDLTTVVLGNGLKSIGRRAFAGCWRLVNMTIPRSVTSIADDAFEACHSRRW